MRGTNSRARGVSLIEALVALAVMAFGTLAVLGVQTSLRLNADIAKQRSEAIRIAQETIETARSFERIADYDALATMENAPVAGYATANATYLVTRTVTDTAEADGTGPRRKGVVVDVAWTDRAGEPQSIRLATVIEGVVPALAGSMAVPADRGYTRAPGGRHRGIPPGATNVPEEGISSFQPPGGDGLSWTFDNVSGFITEVCPAPENCVPANARLLSGFVRFATTAAQPTAADAETPPSAAFAVEVAVAQTAPVAGAVACFEQTTASYVAYYCAVPVTDAAPRWSGRSLLSGLTVATAEVPADPARFRVCRYTPGQSHQFFPDDATPVPPRRPLTNAEHPLNYTDVSVPLTNQNFLVIRAGNGAAAFSCPGDDAETTLVNGNTWRHQPSN